MRCRFLQLLAGLLWVFGAAQAAPTFQVNSADGRSVSIFVRPWLSSKPQNGYVPLSVRVINVDSGDGKWTLSGVTPFFRGVTTSSSHLFTAAKGDTKEFAVLMPSAFGSDSSSGSYESMSFTVSGTAIRSPFAGSLQGCSVTSSLEGTYIALGTQAEKEFPWLGSQIDKAVGRSTNGIAGSKVTVRDTPQEWRGLSGLSGYWMSEGEWRSLATPQKMAVQDWAAMGGRVVIAVPEGGNKDELLRQTLPGLKVAKGASTVGLGSIHALEKKDRLTEGEATKVHIEPLNKRTWASLLDEYELHDWKARDHGIVAPPGQVSSLMFAFILMFAILVGPVNLFVFAGPNRRHRLFWTTPLISLAGSVVLLGGMFLSDGTGGRGIRLTVAVMVPEADRMVIRQEQISRTGVLLGSSFPVKEPSLINQLKTKKRGFGVFAGSREVMLNEQDGIRSGAWFQSRALQSQALQTVRATRGEIRFDAGGGSPSVVSSFEVPLRRLWLVDETGKTWSAQDLAPGERKPLKASGDKLGLSSSLWNAEDLPVLCGPLLRDALAHVNNAGKGLVVAEVDDGSAGKLAIPTLDSIDWKLDKAMLIGPYATESTTQP